VALLPAKLLGSKKQGASTYLKHLSDVDSKKDRTGK
jgi:hypothetical protein